MLRNYSGPLYLQILFLHLEKQLMETTILWGITFGGDTKQSRKRFNAQAA